ncbi:uncharacterized protein Gasu_06730 [Galdieria sulphuraria]|uniref:Uncharacterized protein n=1 Tax=Galdieria sulphuraria TaxID=130081 RepID=M2Y8U7_GALSU|nr:uncharacterized protein Gasu_06730 [Galdieria sulphuraria]EME32264.1 hypothetical protein Gasu_06730 [Galdieria sulphuraria]|eukprot:XP_005708784.1 hypothetical protein Gasu_06730 [Galdieria sulphuraria]
MLCELHYLLSVYQQESLTDNNATYDVSKGSVTDKTAGMPNLNRGERKSRKQYEAEHPFYAEVNEVTSPEPYKRFLDSNPATKRSANVKLHRNVALEGSASPEGIEYSTNKQFCTHEYSAPSNEAILQGQPVTEEKKSLRQLRGNGTEEHFGRRESFLGECNQRTKESDVDFEELLTSMQLQLKKTQTRLAQTESTLSSLQVEYDILSNSFESASQEVERLQAENSELREKFSKLISTKDNIPSVTESENVYRWRTLFQKAVKKLAEERQSRVQAETEKKRALKELEIFEEDIMKRFIALRDQAKSRVKEMKAWTNQMEQIRELLETLPPKLRTAHPCSNEKPKLLHSQATGYREHLNGNNKESKPAKYYNSNTAKSRDVGNTETDHVEGSTLNRVEEELASGHETEGRLLEHWRADAQRLIENFQLFQEENLLQLTSQSERPERLKKRECRYR